MTATKTHGLITYVDANALEWDEHEPGSRRKILFHDPTTGQRAQIYCWDPGFRAGEAASHPHGEYIYVLEGTFVDHNQASGPGTYIHNRPGSEHQPSTPDGCTFIVFVPGSREGSS